MSLERSNAERFYFLGLDCQDPGRQRLGHAAPAVTEGLQPFLHDAVVTLYAPSFVISRADGAFDGGADGFFHGDRRALSRLTVTAEGIPLAPVGHGLRGADRADFRSILRGLGEVTADPAVALHRRRTTTAGGLEEVLDVTNAGTQSVRFRLTVTAGTDLATMEQVKSGRPARAASAQAAGTGELSWASDGFAVRLVSDPAPDTLDVPTGRLSYDIALDPGASWTVTLRCTAAHADGDQFPAPPPAPCRGAPPSCAARTGASTGGWSSRSPTWTVCA